MKKRILITLFAALLFSFSISAQILKGHVYDATTNEPLAGASVTYKLKDTQGVVTDINGAYEVHLPAGCRSWRCSGRRGKRSPPKQMRRACLARSTAKM